MPFTPKDWKNLPDVTTPLSAAALEDMEGRVAGYTDARETQIRSDIGAAYAAADAATLASANANTTSAVAAGVTSANNNTTTAVAGGVTTARAYDSDLAGAWRPWLVRSGAFGGGSTIQTAAIVPMNAQTVVAPGTSSQYPATHIFAFDASRYVVPNYNQKMRLRCTLLTSQSALNANITVAIQPVNTFVSATSGYGVTLFGAAASITWPVHASGQTAQTASTILSSEFYAADLNTGGWQYFAITVLSDASIAGTTMLMEHVTLEHRYQPA